MKFIKLILESNKILTKSASSHTVTPRQDMQTRTHKGTTCQKFEK